MARLCKYPDKECKDRYYKSSKGKLYCRLYEWKKKKGVCPYNPSIRSKAAGGGPEPIIKRKRNQKKLSIYS